MTAGTRIAAAVAAVLLCAGLATGCGGNGKAATAPASSSPDVQQMQKVVDDADHAASAADSDASADDR